MTVQYCVWLLSTLAWEPDIAVEAGWSAVGAAAAVEQELS